MKAVEIRKLSAQELTEKLNELKAELFNLRFQHAINQLDNPMRIKAFKERKNPQKRTVHCGYRINTTFGK